MKSVQVPISLKRATRASVALAFSMGVALTAIAASPEIAQATEVHHVHSLGTSTATGSLQSERVGRVSLPVGASRLRPLATSTRLRIDVALIPRDPAALAAYATDVSTPGSGDYRKFLARGQFASRFGPTAAAIADVEEQLRTEGLRPGNISSNHLIIPVTATTAVFAKAFKTGFETYDMPGGRVAYANTSAPYLGVAAKYVQAVIGLDDFYQAERLGVERPTHTTKPLVVPQPSTSGPQPCSAATEAAPGNDAYTANQVASMYNFQDLYGAGDEGSGITVALFELEPNLASDISAYQSCYGTSATVNYIKEDGGAGTGAGEGEAALDIEDVIGLAPKATIDVYQAPNSNTGLIDNYTAIVDNEAVQVVSTSWGECEAESGSSIISEESTLFEQAATQGQSVFAAAGDDGSTDCETSALGVDDPGSQPYVTSVGGTTTTTDTVPPSQTVWNDSSIDGGAGGGGLSSSHTMPSYQSGAPSSLHVINSDSSGTPCGAASGSYCREVPDVSANADEYTGYLIYYDGSWTGIGGTSAAAPLWAAFTSLTDASSTCDGKAIGFANPVLYDAAAANYSSDFFDVTSGTNDYTPDGYSGGLYPAGTAYDMASGLGTPNGANLPAALCPQANTVTVTNPGNQTATVGTSVSLQMKGSDSASGQTLTWSATGLPAGISIASSTGLITGTPTTPTTSSVSVTAEDTTGASGSASFTWTVNPDTTKTTLKLSSSTVTHGDEQVEKFSVTVSGGGVGIPTGTVTVKSRSKTLCTITLSQGSGSCKLTSSKLAVGTYSVVALYEGNADFDASTSPEKKLKVVS
jgi:subtilase family serine protease